MRTIIGAFGCLLALAAGNVRAVNIQVTDSGFRPQGEKDGKKFSYREIVLQTGNVDYELVPAIVETGGKQFISGLSIRGGVPGGRGFSKRGWGTNGFSDVRLGDQRLFDFPVEIKTVENGVVFSFATGDGPADLTFSAQAGGDKLFLEMKFPKRTAGIQVRLTAYPGDLNKGKYELNDRWIATPKRQVQNQKVAWDRAPEITLGKNEPWIYYYDTLNNPDGKPAFSTCALLYNPGEMEKATVRVGNYGIQTALSSAAAVDAIHLIFLEFPGRNYLKALEYMKGLSIKTG